MSEKKKRKKVHVEYKEEYSESVIRGWMMGKPVVGEAVFDDKNEDVFEPRPSRYVTQSHLVASEDFFYSRSNNNRLGLGAKFVSHADVSNVRTREFETRVHNALMKRLKKEERKRTEAMKLNEEQLGSDGSDSDAEESRTNRIRSTKKKIQTPTTTPKRKKKKKKKKRKRE